MKKKLVFMVLVFLILSGISSGIFPYDEPMVQVRVEKGDCLIRICDRYLEKPGQWRKISEINKMKNPDLIYPGQTILFPASLMKGVPVEGTVTFLQGKADCRIKGTEEWVPINVGDKINEGSFVKTRDDSNLEIKFEDGNTFFLKPNTVMGLKTTRKSGDNYSRYKMSVEIGKIISNIQKATGTESRVEIEAPTAVLGVRGTIFRVCVQPDSTSRFEVIEGSVVVEGKSKAVELGQGEGTIVRKGETPLLPQKLLPPPPVGPYEYLYKKLPVRLSFDKVEGAMYYRVALARDRDIKNIVKEQEIGVQDVFEITDVEDGTYFIQVASIDKLGLEGIPSQVAEIRIRVNPVPPFVEIPSDGAEYKSQSLKCKWLKVKDAARYYVQIAEDSEFKQIVKERKDILKPEYDTGNLDYKKYYFRVSCVASDNYQGEWSDTLTFSFIPPPASPLMEAPETDKNTIRIRWKNLGEGIVYHFQMSPDENFGKVMLDCKVDIPEMTFDKPRQPGNYYVRVSGIDSAGREGSFSQPQSFEIKRSKWGVFAIIGGGLLLLLGL